ncbi:MAG: hypothetical protein JNM66_30370 [Bryobacterales bacterium]|nr:hypothetical protein [Bryobacterales bacterium]
MNEELDAVIGPHSPLVFPEMRDWDAFKIDPVGIDPVIDSIVGFDPVTIDILWIPFCGAETAVNEYLLNASGPEGLERLPEPFEQPPAARGETGNFGDFRQSSGMVAWREPAGDLVEWGDHLAKGCQEQDGKSTWMLTSGLPEFVRRVDLWDRSVSSHFD